MTTSIEITKAEIKRFLTGSNPAVLCISGEWGVGKTFLWRLVLDELRNAKKLSLSRYSYVSLYRGEKGVVQDRRYSCTTHDCVANHNPPETGGADVSAAGSGGGK
jgi:tRNA A37 threonylcarbamoyladenosine biosynthesis protein TsaE